VRVKLTAGFKDAPSLLPVRTHISRVRAILIIAVILSAEGEVLCPFTIRTTLTKMNVRMVSFRITCTE